MASQGNSDFKKRRLNADDYRGSKALKPETIAPADAAVITITDVDEVELEDRTPIVLHSAEYPEYGFWLNKSGTRTMIEKCGDTPGRWIGQRVPLVVVRVNNPTTKQAQKSLQVAPPAEWDEILKQSRPRGKAARK